MTHFSTTKTWQDILETLDLSDEPVCFIGQELVDQHPIASHVGNIKWLVGTKVYVARSIVNVSYKANTNTVEPFITEEDQ